jgi:hypothetical protein
LWRYPRLWETCCLSDGKGDRATLDLNNVESLAPRFSCFVSAYLWRRVQPSPSQDVPVPIRRRIKPVLGRALAVLGMSISLQSDIRNVVPASWRWQVSSVQVRSSTLAHPTVVSLECRSRRADTPGMAVVRVRRSTGIRDRFRKYRILVDSHEVARVKRGETADVTVTPGHHENPWRHHALWRAGSNSPVLGGPSTLPAPVGREGQSRV